jgi:hypothetical protein
VNQNKKKVLCYCAVFLQIKKEAEKNCQNYYKCCSKGGGLWGSGGQNFQKKSIIC